VFFCLVFFSTFGRLFSGSVPMVEGGRDYGFLSLGCVFCDIEASFLVFLLELSEILLVCMSSPFFRVVLSLSSFGDES
jgi:hypothetical protein